MRDNGTNPTTGRCRFCDSPLRHTFVDLGVSPLCESYVSAEGLNRMEPFYPLHVYVCDRHAHLHAAAAERFAYRQLIEIARIVVVDRRPQQAALIAHGGIVRRSRRRRLRLRDRRGRELGKQSITFHRAVRDVLEDRTM